MDECRELALKLACELTSMDSRPEDTVARARIYLSFLNGEGVAKGVIADRGAEARHFPCEQQGF